MTEALFIQHCAVRSGEMGGNWVLMRPGLGWLRFDFSVCYDGYILSQDALSIYHFASCPSSLGPLVYKM